jgi:hypothetical protein
MPVNAIDILGRNAGRSRLHVGEVRRPRQDPNGPDAVAMAAADSTVGYRPNGSCCDSGHFPRTAAVSFRYATADARVAANAKLDLDESRDSLA